MGSVWMLRVDSNEWCLPSALMLMLIEHAKATNFCCEHRWPVWGISIVGWYWCQQLPAMQRLRICSGTNISFI